MNLVINNYRRLKSANITLPPGIIFLAGHNNQGKSTTLAALGALLTGMPVPKGWKKEDAAKLVHRGATEGDLKLGTKDGTAAIQYPDADYATAGTPPETDVVCAGMVDVLALPPKERVLMLGNLLKADPEKVDVAAALVEIGLKKPETLETLWAKLDIDGWDKVHDATKQKGAELKAQWEQITGEKKYGSEKSQKWRPAGFVAGLTRDDAQANLNDANAALEQAIGDGGEARARRTLLQAEVGRIPEIEAEINFADALVKSITTQRDNAQAVLAAIPPDGDTPLPELHCPSCGVVLFHEPGKDLIAAADRPYVDEAQQKKNRLQRADASGLLSNRNDALRNAEARLAKAQAALEQAKKAETDLGADEAPGAAPEVIQRHKDAVATATAALAAVAKFEEAERKRATIENNQRLVALLAPDGVRRKKLVESIAVFNSSIIGPLTEKMPWGKIEMTDDLTITYDGHPYEVLGESVKYRVDAVMRCAFAWLRKSKWLLIDRLDVLIQGEKRLFLALLMGAKRMAEIDYVVVGCSYDTPELVPDLAAKKVGASFWVGNDTIVPLAEALQPAEAA